MLILHLFSFYFIVFLLLCHTYNLFILVRVHVCLNMYLTLSCCDTQISPLGINKGLSYLVGRVRKSLGVMYDIHFRSQGNT